MALIAAHLYAGVILVVKVSLCPHIHTPFLPFSLSLISLVVSVDVISTMFTVHACAWSSCDRHTSVTSGQYELTVSKTDADERGAREPFVRKSRWPSWAPGPK